MLYQITKELDAALKAKNVPFPVVFGPESSEQISAARERVVVEQYIDEKKDTIKPPVSVHRNPDMKLLREQAARVRIYARSPLPNAAWHEHAERAEEVLDRVLAGLDSIVRGRKNAITYGAAGFVSLVDEKGTRTWSGAVYELDIAIDRGVFSRTWAGSARPEVAIGDDNTEPNVVSIRNVVKASADLGEAGTPPNDAENASGG